MSTEFILISLALCVGFYMAWNIGANDVSNAIGTSVGSGALSLREAIIIAAILEFCGAYFFGSHVSTTVMKSIVFPEVFQDHHLELAFGMISALVAAGAWLQIATYFGWPVSTTHSIVGAVVGFGAVFGGMTAVNWAKVAFIALSWLLSPLLGAILSYFIFTLLRRHIFYSSNPVAAAKSLTPWLAFLVTTVLIEVLLIKGFKNIKMDLTEWETFGLACTAGLITAVVSKIAVNRVKTPEITLTNPPLDPKTRTALAKARKHLLRAQETTESSDICKMLNKSVRRIDTISNMTGTPFHSETSREYAAVERIFGYLQILTACFMAFAHGANDVANAIGPLAAAIDVVRGGDVMMQATIPAWILALGGIGIIVGLATWGWRVIETIGRKITELTPSRGFSAEFGAATTIVIATALGMPISTTHTLVGAVLGVGMARGISAVNLNTIRDIVSSWAMTLPAGAGLAVICFGILRALFGS